MAINLVKGQKINLAKGHAGSSSQNIRSFCVGLNWSKIETRGWFGSTNTKDVDLDASAAVFDKDNKLIDIIFFGKLVSQDGAIEHSGDDLTGSSGQNNMDNEIIAVDLDKLSYNTDKIVFFLNSFNQVDFETMPYASIRIYEGTPNRVNNVVANFNVNSDPSFRGKVSMVMGTLYQRNGDWKFSSVGEATDDRELRDTVQTIIRKFI